MKILYALQATGNGHISRANEIIPLLEKYACVDILLSGTQADIGLNHNVKFHKKGLSFVFGKKGGIDFYKTIRLMERKRFLREMHSIPVEDYDFVINDFEPLSAWACRNKNIPCIAMSHQFAVIGKNAPQPKKYDPLAWLLLRYYAPCKSGIGFHFEKYDSATFTPVIRTEIRNAYIRNLGHYTVYLPAYSDKKIIKVLSRQKSVQWQIFSKHSKKAYAVGNCWIRPVNNHEFISSCSTSEGILCGAGFETPAEALFMKKKLMVVPMKGQFEQHCNAAGLKILGVPVLKKLSVSNGHKIEKWLKETDCPQFFFEDESIEAIRAVFDLAGKNNRVLPLRNSPQLPVSVSSKEFAGIA
jgi:uncharacterized protein (TIGR00661 family)